VPHLLLVDDASALAELFAEAIRSRLGYSVTVVVALADVGDALDQVDELALAIVDLSFPQERGSGLDALVEVHRRMPGAKLAIITQGDEWVANILRDAWELLPIATVISKSAPLAYQMGAIEQVVRRGAAPVDPAIQTLLPAQRSTARTAASFGALVQHAGHIKLWRALLATDEPTYKGLAADEAELMHMVATAAAHNDGPIAFRYPRGEGMGVDLPRKGTPLEIGKGRMIRQGSRVAILSFGTRLGEVLKAAESLAAKGLSPTIADARFAKPLDRELILRLAREHEALITVEEGAIGGFGSHVAQLLADEGVFDRGLKYRSMVLPDTFIDHASPEAMYRAAGMNAPEIEAKVLEVLGVATVGKRA